MANKSANSRTGTGRSRDSSGCRTTTSAHGCSSGTSASKRFSKEAAMTATLQFLPDWRAQQQGTIDRGGMLTIEYDKSRLSPSFVPWDSAELGDIIAYCRFHPRGDVVAGSVLNHVSQPLALKVPLDSTDVELWFQNHSQTSSPCGAWDSRFGQNYWFGVEGPAQ